MIFNLFDNPTMQGMEKALDGAALRQKIIANNIANVDTPDYKAMEVTFEDQLKKAFAGPPGSDIKLKITHPRHIQISSGTPPMNMIEPEVHKLKDLTLRNDNNNVDIEREMANNARNELYYNTISRNLNDEFRLLRMVISEGRR